MRNLKRVLSLALASAMLFGMMVVGASAADTKKASDLTDVAKITNKEAVNLMVDLGIIVGKPDGSFAPTEIVDRATMAKLIYVTLTGNSDANSFIGTSTKLTDVKGNWAEGFINYCYSLNVIAGTGDNTYNPSGKVTVAAAAKMLLVALGYDPAASKYQNDPMWSVNIMRDAQANGLMTNVSQSSNEEMTRDNAAQMIFNALFANTVTPKYSYDMGNKYISEYVKGDTLGKITYKLAKVEGVVTGIATNGKAVIDGVTTEFIATPEQVGANVVYYKNGTTNKLISTSLTLGKSSILGTSTDGSTLANLSNVDKAVYIATADTAVTYFYNGAKKDATDALVTTPKVGGIVDLIDNNNNGKYDVVRVTDKTVATVNENGVTITKATSASKKDSVTINGTPLSNIAVDKITGYADLVKDDVILYVTIGGMTYVEKAEVVEGQITSTKTTNGVKGFVMGGTTYTASTLHDAGGVVVPFAPTFADFNKDIALYLDNNGTVVVSKLLEAATPAQYAILIDSAWVTGNSSLSANQYAEAQLVFADGTSEVGKISKVTDDAGVTTTFKYAAGSMENDGHVQAKLDQKFYTYIKDSTTNAYALKEIKAPVTAGAIDADGVINTGKVAFATGYKGNNATIFVISNTNANGDTTYSVKTGIANAPKYDGTAQQATGNVLVNKDGFATIVYIENGEDSGSATKDDMAYFLSVDYVAYPEVKDVSPAYREYDAVVNGKVTTVKVREDFTETNTLAATLMKVTYNTDGYITAVANEADADSAAAAKKGTVKAANGLVGFGNKDESIQYFTYTDDTVVFFIDDGKATAGTIADISTDANDTVYYTQVAASKDSSQPLMYVYVTKVANDGGVPGGGDAATGFKVENFVVTGGSAKANIAFTLTANDIAATGPITVKYTPSRMTQNGTWIDLAAITDDSNNVAANTPKAVSIDYTGTAGYLYKLTVEITFDGETVTYTSAPVEITT